MNDITNKISHYYQQAIGAKNGELFIYNLYNYLECVKNPLINDQVQAELSEARLKDTEKLDKLRNHLLLESKKLISFLKRRSKRINLDLGVKKAFTEYENFTNGSLNISGDFTENIIELVRVLLAHMIDNELTKDLVKQFAVFDKNEILVNWNWSKWINDFEFEKSRVDRISPTRFWYSWDRYLLLFFDIYTNSESLFKEEQEKKNWFSVAGLSAAMKEIDSIKNDDDKKRYYYFSRQDLEHHLKQFHISIRFSDSKASTQLNKDGNKALFKENTLFLVGKKIHFRCDTRRSLLLDFLFKNQSEKLKWSWDEWLEAVDDQSDMDSSKRKSQHYTACEGVQAQIAKIAAITDFLIFNKQDVQINPKYL